MPRSLTQEEFITKANKIVKPHYDTSKTVYKSAKEKVEVTCAKDGHGVFSITPNNLLSGKGCPKCAPQDRGNMLRTKKALSFVARCSDTHVDTYILDKVDYIGMDTAVTVTCREHGDFKILPGNFLKGKGCQLCGNRSRGESNKLTQDEFVQAVNEANPLFRATQNTTYNGYSRNTSYACAIHGEFRTRAQTLLVGAGCPGCAMYGYNTNRAGSFYVLSIQGMVKVGITNRLVTSRVRSIKKSSGLPFEIYAQYEFQDGSVPLTIETTLLRELRSTHTQPTEKFDGSTECFYNVDHDWLLARINELIEEHTECPSLTCPPPPERFGISVATT